MLKKINWRMVFNGFAWVVTLAALVTLMGFIEIQKSTAVCTEVKVILPGNQFFIERGEIDEILAAKNGLLTGRRLSNINIQRLEDRLKANPFIEFAKVYADMDGILHADVRQRIPILRVFNLAGQDFYIDQNGLKIPLSDHFTARVLVASGFIIESFNGQVDTLNTKMAKDIFATAVFIKNDTLWNDQIEQIYVNMNKEMDLVPRVGSHKIILGDAENLKNKFRNLLVFYKKAIPKVGWDTYSSINLKFEGQIVCEKADSILVKKKFKTDSLRKDSIKVISKDTIKNTL